MTKQEVKMTKEERKANLEERKRLLIKENKEGLSFEESLRLLYLRLAWNLANRTKKK